MAAFIPCSLLLVRNLDNRPCQPLHHRRFMNVNIPNFHRHPSSFNHNPIRPDVASTTTSTTTPFACGKASSSSSSSPTHASVVKDGTAIIVVDHGSKRQAANDMIFKVAQDIQLRTPEVPIFAAHMELAEPTIADAVKQCAEQGFKHVIIVPFFLSPGRHATEDIPQLTREAVEQYPDLTYDVRPPIGTHPSIIDVVLDRAGLL